MQIQRTKQIVFPGVLLLSLFCFTADSKDFQWEKITINENSKFETCGVGDINKDGNLDILCGDWWYEGPKWTKYRVAKMEEINGYYNDFANELYDVDHDGDLDVMSCAWFSKEVYWRENPGQFGVPWPKNVIDTPGNMETGFLVDINNDGELDFFPDIAQHVAWYEKVPGKAEWIRHDVGEEGKGHGHGIGDVNQDGVMDIVCPTGWYTGSLQGKDISFTWTPWNPEMMLENASFPILVVDINEDGKNDIVWGSGHGYGLYWLEQSVSGDVLQWIKHEIDLAWSQSHYIAYVDLDKDGKNELVSGKRVFAHNGKDPGGTEDPCLYVYQYDKAAKDWRRQTVSFGESVGFGLNPAIADVDHDGDLDLICPGKSGLYIMKQQ